jgi:hypothetical protein
MGETVKVPARVASNRNRSASKKPGMTMSPRPQSDNSNFPILRCNHKEIAILMGPSNILGNCDHDVCSKSGFDEKRKREACE